MNSEGKGIPPIVLRALQHLQATLQQSRQLLTPANVKVDSDEHIALAFDTLKTDYLAILQLLTAALTKSALALKPPVSWDALQLLLPEIETQVNNLTSCTACFSPPDHGGTLTKTIRSSTVIILDVLLQFILCILSASDSHEYLRHMGTIYETVDAARDNLLALVDNAGAVRRRWIDNHAALEDACTELGDLLAGSAIEDGWDELGIDSPVEHKELTEHEKDICNKVQRLLNLCKSCHKRILTTAINVPTVCQELDLDMLLQLSSALIASADDLVASISADIALDECSTTLQAFVKDVEGIRNAVSSSEKLREDPKATAWWQVFNKQYELARTNVESSIATDRLLDPH